MSGPSSERSVSPKPDVGWFDSRFLPSPMSAAQKAGPKLDRPPPPESPPMPWAPPPMRFPRPLSGLLPCCGPCAPEDVAGKATGRTGGTSPTAEEVEDISGAGATEAEGVGIDASASAASRAADQSAQPATAAATTTDQSAQTSIREAEAVAEERAG